MDLNLDGILRVTATEKRTGLAKHITIEGATTAMSEAEVEAARQRMHALFPEEDIGDGEEGDAQLDEFDEGEILEADLVSPAQEARDRDRRVRISEARALLERSRRLLDTMNSDDREEAIGLHEQIEQALQTSDWTQLQATMTELADLLFYVEER
jgi:molecular chaperone DnaK